MWALFPLSSFLSLPHLRRMSAGPIHAATVFRLPGKARHITVAWRRFWVGRHGVMHTIEHLFEISELMETGSLLKTSVRCVLIGRAAGKGPGSWRSQGCLPKDSASILQTLQKKYRMMADPATVKGRSYPSHSIHPKQLDLNSKNPQTPGGGGGTPDHCNKKTAVWTMHTNSSKTGSKNIKQIRLNKNNKQYKQEW